MTELPYSDPDFGPDVSRREANELHALGERLVAERPVPRAAFRGDLRRALVARPHPGRLRLRAAAFLVSGAALLGVATLGVASVGPLAPSGGVAAPSQQASALVSHR